MNRFRICALLGVLLSAASSVSAADIFGGLFADPVLVKGINVEVRRSQLDEAFIAYRANLAARREEIKSGERDQKEIALLERILLTQIIDKRATALDRTNANTIAEKFLTEAKKAAGDTDEGFARQLRSLGLTVDQFRRRVQEQSLVETLLERELKSTITITEDNMKKFYEENPERFSQSELAKGRHIMAFTRDLRTGLELPPEELKQKRERLMRAQARAKSGEDFAGLVGEYSEDPEAPSKQGEFVIPRSNRLPEIEGAVFSLPLNAVSDIVSTPNAIHILKVTERVAPKKIEFETARGDIEKLVGNREMEKRLPEFFSKLKDEAKLEVLEPKYKTVLDKVSAEAFDPGLGGK